MGQPANAARPWLWAVPLFLLGAAVFTAAYCQAPLYYSNQNQYFLHGLAAAGDGLLREDWLANTLDPTPLFSGLVALTAEYLHPWCFYLYHALLLGAYAASLLGLFVALVGRELAARRWPAFVALLLLIHCGLMRWLSYRWLGLDYPWYFQAGVAGQYVLGAMLQPSVFGVLLVVAVCLFVRGRPFLAGTCVAVAGTVHATYLLPGALLTLGFLAALVREGRPRQALLLGAFTLALVMPVVVYVRLRFGPTNPETFAEAQDILVNVRIPHHARPDLWSDPVAALQLVWIVLAALLAYGTRLGLVLSVPFVLMGLLTLLQVEIGSNELALLFPWRVSSVLVPVATAVILSRLVAIQRLPLGLPVARGIAFGVVALLVAAGIWIRVDRLAFRTGEEEVPMMDYVRDHRRPGDVYFLPVRVPNLAASVRGSKSSDFQPLATKRGDSKIIPIDLQRFRLYTGTPIFVDFKAIPYKDTEVIEWRRRLRVGEDAQRQIREGRLAAALDELRAQGVTHLVRPAAQAVHGAGLREVYADDYYRVYQLAPAAARPREVR